MSCKYKTAAEAIAEYRDIMDSDHFIMPEALEDVLLERGKQELKWGEQNHDPFEYLTILMEEVGEAAQAALHCHHGYDPDALAHFRTEMVQTAAVALAIVECLDRGKWEWPVKPWVLRERVARGQNGV